MKIIVYPHAMEIGGSQLNAVQLTGAVRDATTDVSSVGKRAGALGGGVGEFAAAAIGEGSGFCGGEPAFSFTFPVAAC